MDTAFGGSGKVTSDFGGATASCVAVDEYGRTIAGGSVGLVRYAYDGSVDTSFGTSGRVNMGISFAAVAIQSDGKVIAAGQTSLVRRDTLGNPDTSFDGDGLRPLDFTATALCLQPDGRILVAGHKDYGNGNLDFSLARYNASGSPDTTFGGSGKVFIDFGSADSARCMALQNNGDIVIAGNVGNTELGIARINANGALITSHASFFSTFGDVGSANALAVQQDGKILVTGYQYTPHVWPYESISGNKNIFVIRFSPDLFVYENFGSRYGVITDINDTNDDDEAYAIKVQSNGKIVVAGYMDDGHNKSFVSIRYNSDGSMDRTFGGYNSRWNWWDWIDITTAFEPGYIAGVQVIDFFNTNDDDIAYGMAIAGNGDIVVAGSAVKNGGPPRLALARYKGDALEPHITIQQPAGTALVSQTGTVNFGSVLPWTGGSATRNFVLGNNGGSLLDIAVYGVPGQFTIYTPNITIIGENPGDFGVAASSEYLFSPGETAPFSISFHPQGVGARAAWLRVGSNDPFQNPFLIRLTGTGATPPGPQVSAWVTGHTATRATIGGSVNPMGVATAASLEFGLTSAYGTSVPMTLALNNGTTAQGVSITLTGLSPSATYHCRLTATNSYGTATTSDTIFVTDATDVFFAGGMDETFSNDGAQITPFLVNSIAVPASASGLVRQSDGKLVVCGYRGAAGSTDICLARYNLNGSLDATFGSDGLVTTSIRTGDDYGSDMVIQSDGKIVVVGTTTGVADFVAMRYNEDGTLDSSFGTDGTTIIPVLSGEDWCNAVAIQPDGRLVMCGKAFNAASGNFDFAVVRLLSNGTLDSSFDGDGKRTIALSSTTDDEAKDLAIQPDGRIVVVGRKTIQISQFNLQGNSILLRLNSDGSTDTSFGSGGVKEVDNGGNDELDALVLQTDGKIVACGYGVSPRGNDNPVVMRVLPNGALDATFNGTGVVNPVMNESGNQSANEYLNGLVIQPDGRIVCVGWANYQTDMGIIRLNGDGTSDLTFDGNGRKELTLGTSNDKLSDVLIASNGGIVASGISKNAAGVAQFAVVRLIGGPDDLPADGGFESAEALGGALATSFGDWSNDQASIVVAENGITPCEGTRMAKFLGTSPTGAGSSTASEIEQYVDLTSYADALAAGPVRLTVTCRVNRVAGNSSTDTQFSSTLTARSGTISSGTELGSNTVTLISDANSATWQTISNTCLVPMGTTHLLVSVKALENVVNNTVAPEFAGHYVDNVTLETGQPEITVEQPVGTVLTDGTSISDFGILDIGTAGSSLTFAVRNTGDAPVRGLIARIGGANPGDFTVTQAPGATTLPPGATTTFTVTFTPTGISTGTAVLQVARSDSDEAPFDIVLTGSNRITATFATSSSVPLTSNGFTAAGVTVGTVTLNFRPMIGEAITLVDNTGSGPVNGFLNSLPQGSTVTTTFGGDTFYLAINYTGGDGNDITLSRVIAPGQTIAYAWTNLAGMPGGAGNTDDRFNAPEGVAVASSGNVYVADTSNSTIRKITPTGVMTTVAGSAGLIGYSDGTGSAARFRFPSGIAVDDSENVYVADTDYHTIRKITPAGVVSTLAGSAGSLGSTDGTGSSARFNYPSGVAVDISGNVYVADKSNHTIRKITPAGVVTTLAGTAGSSGSTDGSGSAARFNNPNGVAADGNGNVYVADYNNHTLRKITSAGVVTTLAGSPGIAGSIDGAGNAARFRNPSGVTVDGSGIVYVTDYTNHTIRKVTSAGVVTTLTGSAGSAGSVDGTGSAARFFNPKGLAVDGGGNLYIADRNNSTIRKVSPATLVTTLAGTLSHPGSADGIGSAARFSLPGGVAVGGSGNIYIADSSNNTIRKVSSSGAVTTLAGSAGSIGSVDGSGSSARFNNPSGIAVDGSGNIYVADTANSIIRKVSSSGMVTTLAGTAGSTGSVDGTGSSARFNFPNRVTVDDSGNVYVADSANHTLRKLTPAGVVTTVAGTAGSAGSTDGIGSNARFNYPNGVAVGSGGNIYVTDQNNHTIRKVTPTGVVSTMAGTAGILGSADGTGSIARFFNPRGMAVDSTGNAYVADSINNTIRKVTPGGMVTTIGGTPLFTGGSDGVGAAVSFDGPYGVAVNNTGTLFVADRGNHRIAKGTPVTSPSASIAAVSGLRGLWVTLNGTVNPNGLVTTVQFEYGLTTSYGSSASIALTPPTNDTVAHSLSTGITGLTQNTTYHYRLIASNADGTVTTADSTFTTLQAAPEIAIEQPLTSNVADGGSRNFGSVALGASTSLTFTIKNTGDADLTGLFITKNGTNSADFTITASPTAPVAGPSGSTSFTVRFAPGSLGVKTAAIHIANNDADENPFDINLSGTGATAATVFSDTIAASSTLTGSDALPTAIPFNDGVKNLLKYAFNMNLAGPDARSMTAGTGTAGLPAFALVGTGPGTEIRMEFLRRKGSGLIYTAKHSTSLTSFAPMTGTTTVTSINDQWERVLVQEPCNPATTPRCFGIVEVTLP